MQTPDTGLAHARVRQAIAVYLMRDNHWSRALPYAEEAAKTGTAWALLTAAGCQEGMQNWDAADRCLRSVAVSYVDSPADWYFFCRRTGHGDLASARKAARDAFDQYDPRTADQIMAMAYARAAGPYYLLEEEFDKAKRHFEKDFAKTKNPHQGLHLALLADRMKDAAKRDAVLQQVRNEGSSFIREATGKPRKELIALAGLFVQDLAHGGKAEIDLDAAARLRAIADVGEQMNFNYYLASYLDLHGKTGKAIQYWKLCMGYTGAMRERQSHLGRGGPARAWPQAGGLRRPLPRNQRHSPTEASTLRPAAATQ